MFGYEGYLKREGSFVISIRASINVVDNILNYNGSGLQDVLRRFEL